MKSHIFSRLEFRRFDSGGRQFLKRRKRGCKMYRQYENPYELEKMLEKLKKEYDNAIKTNADEETLIYLHFEIDDLEERINFAYQDQEE